MTTHLPTFPSDMFESDDGVTFTAWASDLSHAAADRLMFGPIVKGRLDRSGFNIKSVNTGVVKAFEIAERIRNFDNDIVVFHMKPLDTTLNMKIIVFNT